MSDVRSQPAAWRAPESRGAFGGFIGPRNLVDLVTSAAPWLFDGTHPQSAQIPPAHTGRLSDLASSPLGWWTILLANERLDATTAPTPAQRTDYFALCLAAHFASAATYVPTDVDAKIRHALWLEQAETSAASTSNADAAREELARMRDIALGIAQWDISPVSARIVHVPDHAPRAPSLPRRSSSPGAPRPPPPPHLRHCPR
jgi:hypothetical protein